VFECRLSACLSELKAEREAREHSPAYRLEELRNARDELMQEKEAWAKKREKESRLIDEQLAEFKLLQVRANERTQPRLLNQPDMI